MRFRTAFAAALTLLPFGSAGEPRSESLWAFVPDDARLVVLVASIEALEGGVRELRGESTPDAFGLESLARRATAGAPRYGSDWIDRAAPSGFVVVEDGGDLATVRLFTLRAAAAADARSADVHFGDASEIRDGVVLVSDSESALSRCSRPARRNERLRPTLEGDLVVSADVHRLVERSRADIESRLRRWERVFVQTPSPVSYGPKVSPLPNERIAEGVFRFIRRALFGIDTAELAIGLNGGELRLETAFRAREGTRAAASLGAIASAPVRLDLVPDAGELLAQMSTSGLDFGAWMQPFNEWQIDGLPEPARGELLGLWRRMASASGLLLGGGGFAGGSAMTYVTETADPTAALETAVGYWRKLSDLRDFFATSEEVPIRVLTEERATWEHGGRTVREFGVEMRLQEESEMPGGFLEAFFGKSSSLCVAATDRVFLQTLGADAPARMRRAIDALGSGERFPLPEATREWLARIPRDVSVALTMDLRSLLVAMGELAHDELRIQPPETPLWFRGYFLAKGSAGRAGLEIGLGGFLRLLDQR